MLDEPAQPEFLHVDSGLAAGQRRGLRVHHTASEGRWLSAYLTPLHPVWSAKQAQAIDGARGYVRTFYTRRFLSRAREPEVRTRNCREAKTATRTIGAMSLFAGELINAVTRIQSAADILWNS
jgi:hypothetical protein